MPKWELANMTHLFQCTRKQRKKNSSTNNKEHEFWFCHDDIKRLSVTTKMNMLWQVKIGTDISRDDVLVLEDAMFQLQQREGHFRLVVVPRQLGHSPYFNLVLCDTKHWRLPNFQFLKTMHHNPSTPTKWDNDGLIDGYYVVKVTAIL